MSEIPDDVMRAAREAIEDARVLSIMEQQAEVIARAILAEREEERERCARIADHFALHFDDPCDTAYDIARIIRKPDAA